MRAESSFYMRRASWRAWALTIMICMSNLSVRAAEWEALPSLPEGSGNFVCGTIRDDLVLLGGIGWQDGAKQWRGAIWRFNPTTKEWSTAGILPRPVAYAAFGETQAGLYFAGGSDGQTTHDTLQFLNGNLELQTVARFPHPLCYSGHAIGDGRLFVVSGGTDANDLKTLTNLCYTIDLRTGKTASLPEYPGGNLLLPAAAMTGRRVYVFGGASWDAAGNRAVNVDSAFACSLEDNAWKAIKPYPFPVRGLASCVLDERYILLGGGYGEAFTDFAGLYDTERDSYLKTQPLPSKAMANFIKAGDFIYWVGGEHAMRQRSDAVYRVPWKALLREAQDEASRVNRRPETP
jgi:hypothetical protein